MPGVGARREESNTGAIAEARKHERPPTALARTNVEKAFLKILRRKYPDRAWSAAREDAVPSSTVSSAGPGVGGP
jgi:hypothetical protein